MIPVSEGYVVVNSSIVLEDRILKNSAVAVSHGGIAAVGVLDGEFPDLPRMDARGLYLAPAFVELHIHGCGSLLDSDGSPDVLEKMLAFLSPHGVGTMVPTLGYDADSVAKLSSELDAKPRLGRRVPGLYLEGPFVSPGKRGGLAPESLRAADPDLLDRILGGHRIRLMTIAPELPGIAAIASRLEAAGVIPAFGHSLCTLEEAGAVTLAGRPHLTHLFNAMSGIAHHGTGLASLPFLDRDASFELNGDGIHLDPDMIRLCVEHLDRDALILIDDAMVGAGSPYGDFLYAGKPIVSDERGCRYKDSGILVGSNCLIDEVVRRTVAFTGIPVELAFRFASLNPARRLGLGDEIGSIAAGKRADLILLDEKLNVVANLSSGLDGDPSLTTIQTALYK
jgi:N-acetylglucosamine-6-phosphate deacetylase